MTKPVEKKRTVAAVILGRKGGKVKSEAKRLACIANAKKPRKKKAVIL